MYSEDYCFHDGVPVSFHAPLQSERPTNDRLRGTLRRMLCRVKVFELLGLSRPFGILFLTCMFNIIHLFIHFSGNMYFHYNSFICPFQWHNVAKNHLELQWLFWPDLA